jgi:ligand-binding sensor domain-containing protein
MEEQDSLLWIGTVDGLNLFNKNDHSFRVFRSDPKHKNSLASNYILCLFSDSKGNKWVGTRGGGFYKIEDKTNAPPAIKRIQPVNDTISVINVHCITEDHQGFLWIGTGGSGFVAVQSR